MSNQTPADQPIAPDRNLAMELVRVTEAGALAAGMQSAWVNRAGSAWPADVPSPPPHAVVRDLARLCELLGAASNPPS